AARGTGTAGQLRLTTVQEGRAMPGQTGALIAAAEQGLLEVDVAVYPDIMAASQDIAAPWLSRTYRKHLRVAGAKLSLDGSPQGKTAWLTEPYFRAPAGLPADYRGYPAYSDAQVQAAVGRAYEQGWQLLVHVNGDAAIDQLIAAVRSARERFGAADRRTVAIHAQTVREDQLDAFKALGIMPSFYSMHTFYWGDWHRDSVLGPARAARISPAQSAIDRGMHFTSHHDAPVVMPNPARMLSSMVTRRTRSGEVLGPEQRITPYAALRAITLDAAYQYFEEAEKGSISVGKLADLVLLSDNPLTMAPDTLASDLKVLETIKAGRTIYRAPAR
ncbi:MAG TPA: amidohydrolase family protein, partial [Spongiibacteraceae bacterium]|nr:amidohydrolase family protein [Spongiibacteraceae bacterium]